MITKEEARLLGPPSLTDQLIALDAVIEALGKDPEWPYSTEILQRMTVQLEDEQAAAIARDGVSG